jgi:hypothetical protein
MEHQAPDPARGPSPSQGARVEDDIVRRLTPTKNASRRRLAAALPTAIVTILVVATIAFGATVVRPMVLKAQSSATPVVVGDDGPDDTPTPGAPTTAPTASPTDEPTAGPTTAPTAAPTSTATSGRMKLTDKLDGRKVVLAWTAYQGADFAYYKVVRSSDKAATWPLGAGDSLVAAFGDQSKLTCTDSPTAGKTWSYEVFAVKSTAGGYVVLESTNLVTVAVPAVPKPTADNPADLGALHVVKNSDGTYTFSWAAYDGTVDFSYYKLDGEPFPAAPGYVENAGHYWACLGTTETSATVKVEAGTWNVNVEAVYYPNGAAVAARTDTLKLVVAPAPIPTIGLDVTVGDDGFAHLDWDKYTGDHFQEYLIVRTESGTPTQANVVKEISDVGVTTWVDKTVNRGHTYNYRVLAWTSETFCTGGTILAQSPVKTITIPAAATPAPTAAPSAKPSASQRT